MDWSCTAHYYCIRHCIAHGKCYVFYKCKRSIIELNRYFIRNHALCYVCTYMVHNNRYVRLLCTYDAYVMHNYVAPFESASSPRLCDYITVYTILEQTHAHMFSWWLFDVLGMHGKQRVRINIHNTRKVNVFDTARPSLPPSPVHFMSRNHKLNQQIN